MSKDIISKKSFKTDFKTTRINQFTGGKIADYVNKSLCFEGEDDTNPKNFTLTDSFLAPDGTYLGGYKDGWWYFKKNMVVCFEYPHGVAILLKHLARNLPYFSKYKSDGIIKDDDIKGYYGYSHRGGNVFVIGDRLFDESYEPKKEDYTPKEWNGWEDSREKSIKESLKEGYWDTREIAEANNPISDFVPFKKRGVKIIETWEEAKQSAINMSKYLS